MSLVAKSFVVFFFFSSFCLIMVGIKKNIFGLLG